MTLLFKTQVGYNDISVQILYINHSILYAVDLMLILNF